MISADTLNKPALRRHYRTFRQSLTPENAANFGQQIQTHLSQNEAIIKARHIAAYWPFDGEPDLRAFLRDRVQCGVQVSLPLVPQDPADRHLSFRLWEPNQSGQKNRFGITEPEKGSVVTLSSMDVILIPLVAWDRAGGRLGIGGGYYDQTMAGLAGQPTPLRLGVAWQGQLASNLPTESHDISLHAVVTEQGWFTCPF